MKEEREMNELKESSQGQALSEGDYLDTHYMAAQESYEAMMKAADFQPGWRVLDAGAGSGSFLPLLSHILAPNGLIHAIDLAPENVAMIQQRAAANSFTCPLTARTGNLIKLPFEDDSFDAIWCANVFQYLTDEALVQSLHEFKRVVRPGGRIVIKDADLSANLHAPESMAYWQLMAKARTHPKYATWINGAFRTIHLPDWFRHCGISLVSYQTFIAEWRYPIPEAALPYLTTLIRFVTNLVKELGASEEDMATWHRIMNPTDPDYFLTSSDFYMRGASALIIGTVPNSS
jgi:ubiquinone/menaquinone biosynthesis C-methylase UbiE